MLVGLLGCVQAISTSGNRLLVVVEELAEKEKYSKFLGDLKGMMFSQLRY
jgi:oligosaccharyltransferase complex subunit beta